MGDEESHFVGQAELGLLGLALEDGDPRFKFRRLDGDGQARTEARFEPVFQSGDFLGVAVAGQDHLLAAFQQAVEGVEKFFLRALLARQKLHIVDQQGVQRPVTALEFIDGVVLQGTHHIGHEVLAILKNDSRLGVAFAQHVADGVDEVSFAQAGAAVDE